MEASGLQNRMENRCELRQASFRKTCFFLRKNNDFEGSGGSNSNGKSIENRLEIETEDGVALVSDFS